MGARASLAKEIVVNVANKIGVLADMSKILADHGINIEGVAGYATEANTAQIMLVTEDDTRAMEALKKAGYANAKENEVVVLGLENKLGALKNITAKLAEAGVDIKYIYGTACAGSCPAKIIMATVDNEKAVVAFNK